MPSIRIIRGVHTMPSSNPTACTSIVHLVGGCHMPDPVHSPDSELQSSRTLFSKHGRKAPRLAESTWYTKTTVGK
ncbi:hypothetical protein BDR07DRAFT_1409186 [Suillus spraguei]|nr:hypothetical protein BDR07DRAFT_1409186 [Suillus spraguei]